MNKHFESLVVALHELWLRNDPSGQHRNIEAIVDAFLRQQEKELWKSYSGLTMEGDKYHGNEDEMTLANKVWEIYLHKWAGNDDQSEEDRRVWCDWHEYVGKEFEPKFHRIRRKLTSLLIKMSALSPTQIHLVKRVRYTEWPEELDELKQQVATEVELAVRDERKRIREGNIGQFFERQLTTEDQKYHPYYQSLMQILADK